MKAHRWAGGSVALVALAALAGCSEEPMAPEFQVIDQLQFDASLGIDLSQMTMLASGVYYEDRTAGTGAPLATGDLANVDHTGWFFDGTVFSMGEFSYEYEASPRQVIAGFQEGMEGMMAGGTRLIIIPPEQAYGANPPPGIPFGAVLVFEVELLSVS